MTPEAPCTAAGRAIPAAPVEAYDVFCATKRCACGLWGESAGHSVYIMPGWRLVPEAEAAAEPTALLRALVEAENGWHWDDVETTQYHAVLAAARKYLKMQK